MRTSQTALEAKVTKLGSADSSLKDLLSPTPVMLRTWPIAKYQLRHEWQLEECSQQMGMPEIMEPITYVQYTLEDLRELAKLLEPKWLFF
jgi:hypothetical protein